MPGGALKLRDVRKLSEAQMLLEADVSLSEMPGLPPGLMPGRVPLHVQARFGVEQGRWVAHVALSGELQMTCQRCMRPMRWPVDTQSPVLLIESESQAEGAPLEWETFLASEGKVSLAALAAEELLLGLPIVPLHADSADCTASVPAAQETVKSDAVVTRPFADLRALLEQATKPGKSS
jgi:uncharacterized protein